MMKKLSKILACGWSIEANPGLLLAETAQFSENLNNPQIPDHQCLMRP